MQFDRAAIDLLIFLASSRRMPSLPVLLKRSDPARSTTVSSAFLKNFFFTCGPSVLGSLGRLGDGFAGSLLVGF